MEHANTTNIRRQQQKQQQQLQQHQLEQQQQHHENQQQFCLRWHNHQTSLLSTLPVLLDQSYLTDVTISAEGRTLRAHRVVLSACSTFFMELFRALEASSHPVIIIPGASFAAIVALLTFMYSGEVNVYEEQIPMLLNLAETLGIKGLTDVQNNFEKSKKRSTECLDKLQKDSNEYEHSTTPATPPSLLLPSNLAATASSAHVTQSLLSNLSQTVPPPLTGGLFNSKLSNYTPLESLLLKSLQFYPNLLPQPLNFSQTALNKTNELLAKYQQQCGLYQGALSDLIPTTKDYFVALENDDASKTANMDESKSFSAKRFCSRAKTPQSQPQLQPLQQQSCVGNAAIQRDIKRIDKIVENLCSIGSDNTSSQLTTVPTTSVITAASQSIPYVPPPLAVKLTANYTASHLHTNKPELYNNSTVNLQTALAQTQNQLTTSYIINEDHTKFQQHVEQFATNSREPTPGAMNANALCTVKSESNLLALNEKMITSAAQPVTGTPPAKLASNSKLYATCFICHKQLSNQYNLRVHLETHQNVRYACNVCSHVSRSKDALRKHVSYRHPGAASPCDTEARRKRGNKLTVMATNATMAAENTNNRASVISNLTGFQINDTPLKPLSGNPYLFLPNQFHLTAAAAVETAASAPLTMVTAINNKAAVGEALDLAASDAVSEQNDEAANSSGSAEQMLTTSVAP